MQKLIPFLTVMSLMFLADAMLADFAPGFLESILSSSILMGLVMSCSSLAGITLDLLFAQLLRGVSVSKMMYFPIGGGVLFALLLLFAREHPELLLLVGAMAVWGLYYEFFGFATQQYVSEVAPPHGRASAWGIVTMVKSTIYMIGPLLGAWLMRYGEEVLLLSVVAMMGVAFLLMWFIKIPSRPAVVQIHEINLRSELSHWRVLYVHIWPILVLSVFMGLIDALFWTNGTIINDRMAQINWVGGLFVSAYMFPSLIAPFILSKMKIEVGKKRKTLWLVLGAGLALSMITVVPNVYWYLGVVLVASFLLALAWPMLDAVYTDLLARMGRERKHLIGLGNSTMSVAYVIGPLMAGIMGSIVGELESFAVMGGIVVVICVGLLCVTPRKLKLPQGEIQSWE